MSAIAAQANHTLDHDHDRDYGALLSAVTRGFKGGVVPGCQPLFTTDAADLWQAYLDHLPAERQVHNCSTCRHFITHFGGLVAIAEDGTTESALWHLDDVPAFYRDAIEAMRQIVKRAWVTGPFLSGEAMFGTPRTGPWTHFSAENGRRFTSAVRTAGQAMAAKREDYNTVARALAEFTPDMLAQAMRLLEADALARSEKFIGPVRWLQDVHTARAGASDRRILANLLWRAIATAPDGYCHSRASVVGPLLEDIAAGLPFETIKRRFDAKLHPLRYQRPQAAPAAGNIEQAEQIVARLGIARSLERRFARLDEIETIWKPGERAKPAPAQSSGVFGHLRAKGEPAAPAPLDLPTVTMTWEKFARTVLPGAEAIDYWVPPGPGPYIALVTAVHADAPPILKWDREERRNPVSWYVHHLALSPQKWRLTAETWVPATGIARLPTMWGDQPKPYLGDGVALILEGAADIGSTNSNALFPEILRGELHQVRATIEAYSKSAKISGVDEASACGIDIRHKPGAMNHLVRVRSTGGWASYRIDRWD